LNIKTTSTNYTVEVYTIQGQLINEIKNVSEIQTIDFNGYAKGIYLMKISSENAVKTYKVLKE
jgi:hypothetical protein